MTTAGFDQRDGFIWHDGKMTPWRETKVHVLNHGLHYASSVFEGIRCYNGRIFKLREHIERLLYSAEVMDLVPPYSLEQIEQAVHESLKVNKITDGYIRPVIWRGSEKMAVAAKGASVHLAVACWPWPAYFSPEARMKGISLITSKWRRPAPDCAPVHAKAAGLYMICTLAKHAAMDMGFDDALMIDYRGQIAESTASNIFFVMKGEIHTPRPDCFLNGITRQTVIELAKKRGLKVHERAIVPDELVAAEEVFVTGTAAEVTPVNKIDNHTYKIGPVTQQMMEDYTKLVTS
jgi:branched-chain amino acid aminotransferase